MNRKELVRRIATVMRENDIKKPVSFPKQVLHISDDEGNARDFSIKKSDKSILFTVEDIDAMVDACLCVMEDALRHGEHISIRGFGTLALQHRKARTTKHPDTGEPIDIEARYVPKFTFGNDLRLCAKIYELSLADGSTSCDEDEERPVVTHGS